MLEKTLEATFNEAVLGLNPKQREAVETIEGPVMVVAGPGTGKTQILTLRIANILKQTDTKPGQILALTFTESGVRAMRSRLVRFIGASAYQVPIHTFHSFAGELIRRYPDAYDKIVGGRPASELEKIALVESILESANYKYIRPHGDPAYYVKPILGAIATMKKEYVSSDDLALYIRKQEENLKDIPQYHEKGAHKGKVRGEYLEAEKKLGRNQELLAVFRQYEAGLRSAKLYDFEDMVLDTIKALESNESMLRDLQEQYLYVLADEHQDVNQSQNKLIEMIVSYHENPNIFVVGDEKQAIYRFQGASLDNFLYFGDIYKGVKIISLETNYRSDQAILDVAQEAIKTDDPTLTDLRTPLRAHNTFSHVLNTRQFSHTDLEEAWVVDEVVKYIKDGVTPSEIAIIVRTNREVEYFAKALRRKGVHAAPSSDSDILEHPLFDQINNLINLLVVPENETALVSYLHTPYSGFTPSEVVELLCARRYGERLRDLLLSSERMTELSPAVKEKAAILNEWQEEVLKRSVTATPAETLELLLEKSRFLNFVLEVDPVDGARVVRRIYDEVLGMHTRGEVNNLAAVLEQFKRAKEHSLPMTAPFVPVAEESVVVMTAHKAKGLEFEAVFLPHLTDSAWGGGARAELFDLPVVKHEVADAKEMAFDDERRLFYVALTRAKRVVECSVSLQGVDGRAYTPSRLLVEIESGLKVCDTKTFEHSASALVGMTALPVQTISAEFVLAALKDRGWSATSFNNYTKSPWEYIYKNALRVPSIKTPELHFGTAVHAVLDKAVRKFVTSGEWADDTLLKEWLEEVLGMMPITTEAFTRLLERGLEAVFAYLPTLKSEVNKYTKTEYKVEALLTTGLTELPEVRLTGNFDRLDVDEGGLVLRVVDYKTGKAKTRGEIEGTTKTSDGSYKRQLTFYALLLSLQSDTRLHSRYGRLVFVEPDQKGVLRQEDFTITDEDIDALKGDILAATKAIVTGECLLTPCDPEKTNFCPLVEELMRPKL